MAFRLSDHVVCGELLNTRKNSTHGWIGLRGFDRPVSLQLTGNCDPDLEGRHIRFELRDPDGGDGAPADDSDESENARLKRLNLGGLAWRQIGPTGTMTAARQVKVADCPPGELYTRCQLGEPPPMTWKRCLYLEWFGQNGRVVIELVDPIIEFVNSGQEPASAQHDPGADQSPDDIADGRADAGLSITSFSRNDEGEIEIRDETAFVEDGEADADESEDPYGLMPHDLQKEFDAQARETDRAVGAAGEEADVIRELELMDDLIERGEGQPLGTLFDEALKLPRPDQLDEPQAEGALKTLLAMLALHGVAYDICEHFTMLDAYRLLVEQFCAEESAYPELRGTQWVQHFSTSDSCEACQAEFDRP